MLFTNATGTGKTFTGLGIVKRFVRQGKDNILIVTPTDKKNRDWASDAKRVNLTVTPLTGTQDNGGNGIAVTTYANFRQNESLQRRNWDLLVFDESHKISSAEGKIDTLAKQQLDRLAGVKDIPFRRAFEENKAMLRDELAKIDADYLRYDLERTPEGENPVLSVRDIEEHWDDLPKSVQKMLKDREAELSRSKVLFLSATPFSYHNSLLYADGYLFDIPERESHGYNAPDGVQDFFITNFGYRMRYGKLTKPDADVDVSVMERAFYEKMRKSGAVSGRMLDIDKDYSREFFRVRSDLGEKIQAGMDMVMDYKQYPAISALIHKLYDYNYVTSLLECLKSKATVDEIKKDLAAGRKVVVFHNRNTGTPAHPFHLGTLYNYCETERQHQALKEEIERFETEHPELVNLRLNDLQNPLMYFRKVFGDKALFFDGTIPAKKRALNVEEFNDAKSGKNLIVVQIEAGKEGISLHDTKGDAQRVLYNLGLPTKPTDLIQSEGRIYRLGSKSNAIFRYPVTGLPMERYAFGSKINQRASTAENLGMGDAARNLRDALREGYMNAGESLSFDQQGIGGKEADRGFDAVSDYERAKTFYFGQLKRNSKNKSAEGIDYFATPEPIGYKMVEWAHLKPGDRVLEPSAGHGAIARFFPDTVDAKAIEPSNDLSSKLTVNTTAQVIRGRFEDHNAVNKYDCVLMNPPFGIGGKTAIEHLAKAFDRHLNNFGRVIAIIPEGGMADRRFTAWMNNTEEAHLTAEIGLPPVTFQRAGTSVKTKIVVIDKSVPYLAGNLPPPQQRIDISSENIKDLFDRLENIEMPRRGGFDYARDYTANTENDNAESETGRHYSLVRDAQTKRKLEEAERRGDTITTYRAAQLHNGKLYPPMAGRINGDWGTPIQLGQWEQADEHPELIVKGDKFKLDKGNGSSITAAYNPYIHSSETPLNDQFSSAYKRPELVTLEVRVPKSELTSGYHAEHAKDSVGMKEWKAGVVQGKLSGKRQVMLSRWDKPIRVVPDSEVAEKIAELLKGTDVSIPANVVTPQLREELEKIGVPVTDNLRNYSLKRHKQVNPIREPGDAQSQHEARLDEPYETRSITASSPRAAMWTRPTAQWWRAS